MSTGNGVVNRYVNSKRYGFLLEQLRASPDHTYKEFSLRDNEVFFGAKPVVPEDRHIAMLNTLYRAKEAPQGQTSFYKYVNAAVAGIPKHTIITFLKSRSEYQLTRPTTHYDLRPITANHVRDTYCVDLIDYTPYLRNSRQQYRYVLNCVDVRSRFCMLRALKSKTDVPAAFDSICTQYGSPHIVLSDNGLEFSSEEFAEICRNHNIHQSHTPSHSPQSNGICERANSAVRAIMRRFMFKTDSLDWAAAIEHVQDQKNQTWNRQIAAIPMRVWQDERSAPLRPIAARIQHFHMGASPNVGDMVRVRMTRVFSDVRAKVKAKESRLIVITYTPLDFEVAAIIGPQNGRTKYTLYRNNSRELITDSLGAPVHFNTFDLQLSNHAAADITMDRALELDKSKRTATDLVYE